MKTHIRVPLSPCDYLVFNHNCFMRYKEQGAYTCLMTLEIEGHVKPERVRQALAGVFLAHPVMAASLRVSVVFGRPFWVVPMLTKSAAQLVAAVAHRFVDLRGQADAEERLRASMDDSFSAEWREASGPQIRLDQYAMPSSRTMFCLRWLHFLMDAEGAQRFFSEMDRLASGNAEASVRSVQGPSAATQAEYQAVDPLRGYSRLARWRLAGRCFQRLRQDYGPGAQPLHPRIFPPAVDHRCLLRSWSPDECQSIRANAQHTTLPGPGLYARHLLACTIRALDRVYARQGVTSDAYLLTMPFRMPLDRQADSSSSTRPVHGNYLVPLTICGRRALAENRSALGEDILRQYKRFTQEGDDVMWCAMMWALGHLRLSMYQALLRLQLGFAPLASGFSYYGEIEPPLRSFLGGRVLNQWGTGAVATPPGWNAVFSRCGDRLNLAITYARPAIPDALAEQYARWLEEEMFAI